jgi:hypothetical protein
VVHSADNQASRLSVRRCVGRTRDANTRCYRERSLSPVIRLRRVNPSVQRRPTFPRRLDALYAWRQV